MGLPVKRQDIVNWQAKSTKYYLKPVYQLLKEKLLEQPITLYQHNPHSSGRVALDFLRDYAGFLHCDMWQAYQQLPNATLVGLLGPCEKKGLRSRAAA